MKLVVGGSFQGKYEFAKQHWKEENPEIWNQLHLFIRTCLEESRCPEEEIAEYIELHPNCILISDEIGNGIVPVDAFEREYRERCGRILVELARQADEVVRVTCGIGQKIK